MDGLEKLRDRLPPFSQVLGVEFLEADTEHVRAQLTVRPELCNGTKGVLHGGAIMAFADTLGAMGTVLNLPEDGRTTTLESKTNFIGPAPIGTTVIGESTPLHRGRRSMVWQTRITNEAGKLVAIVTQTQMVL